MDEIWEQIYYGLYVLGDMLDRIYYELYTLYSYFYDFFHYSSEDIDSCCRR